MLPEFRPAWWLPGPHLQSGYSALARPVDLVSYRREAIETPDGDELVLDHIESARPDTDRLLLLHGLEGSSHAVYIQGMAQLARAAGWAVTAINFRSCARHPESRERWLPNRTARLYHSGETGDLDHVVRVLAAREPGRRFLAAGVSLGGNVLLKWLGEQREAPRIAAAATISVPYDLAVCATNLRGAINGIYTARFLRSLKPKALNILSRFANLRSVVDERRVRAARTFHEFDQAVTAPLHGFTSAQDYYDRSSSLGFLGRVTVPTLCISAADDPFQPRAALERAREAASATVEVRITHTGGHAGFVQGVHPGATSWWAEEAAIAFLARGR